MGCDVCYGYVRETRYESRLSIEDNDAASLSSVKYLVIKRMRRRTSVTS